MPTATSTSNAASGASVYSLHTAQVTVAYVLDVWGGTRRQIESLEALTEAQAFQREGVYLTLTANIALAAIQEASLRGQIAATRRLIDLQTRLLGILRRQNNLGQIALPDVLVQETALAQARLLLPPLERQLDQQRHLLATLTGRFPSEEVAASFRLGSFQLPRQLPLTLPADLVCQRPDVRAAEAAVRASNAQVGVAIANRLPQITLSGNAGSTAEAVSQLFAPGTNFWMIAGNALQPVFDGGTLRYKQKAAEESLDAVGGAIPQRGARRLPERRRRAARAAGRCPCAQRGRDGGAGGVPQSRSRAQATRAGPGEPADPAQRPAGLFADIAGSRTSRGRTPRRYCCAVPGAWRRLVEQVGSHDHAPGLDTAMKQRASRVPAGSMGRAVSARAAGDGRARWLTAG